MGAWGLPVAAAAFWAGLLAWDLLAWPRVVAWWAWLVVGLVCLCLAVATVPRARRADPLAATGLVEREPATVAAVRGEATGVGGPASGALALLLAGLVTVGVGWGGLAAVRRDGSFLAGRAPAAASLIGTLREDPRPGAVGWHAYLDVAEVTLDGERVRVRETVWVGGDDQPPDAVRGDLLRVEGGLERPEDPGFAEALAHHGVAVAVRADALERLGPAPNPFIRLTQV
ncbi:MAG TPA: hypothetical protein VF140_06615, partial [Phycicoccus sp.]